MENVNNVNLVKKNGIYLGSEEVIFKTTGEIFNKHSFVFDTETTSIFINSSNDNLLKQIINTGIKPNTFIEVEGELKLKKGKEKTYWNYSIKTIKKV